MEKNSLVCCQKYSKISTTQGKKLRMMSDMIQGLCFSIAMTGLSRIDTGIKMIYVFFVVRNNTAAGTWTL